MGGPSGGGSAVLTRCTIKRCGTAGILASEKGSGEELRSCLVVRCWGSGFAVNAGVNARAAHCEFSHSADSCGVWVRGTGAQITMEQCKLEGNATCGVHADSGAVAALSWCSSVGHSAAFKAVLGASMTLSHCYSDEDDVDCCAAARWRVVLKELVVDGVSRSGVVSSASVHSGSVHSACTLNSTSSLGCGCAPVATEAANSASAVVVDGTEQ